MVVVYVLMVALAALLGLIGVRYLLFGLVWIVTGHSFWLFPYLMSDEVGPWAGPGPGPGREQQWVGVQADTGAGAGQDVIVALGLAGTPVIQHSPRRTTHGACTAFGGVGWGLGGLGSCCGTVARRPCL